MSSYLDDPDAEIRSLPQCGFGSDIDFNTLIKSNQFLFRVYTPKERSPFSDDTDPFFLAPRFDEQVARSPVDLPTIKFSEPSIGSFAEVARHMEWTTRTSSSYISTSFSFSWSIWEAVKRYHQGMKKDVEIAIIDASALGGRAATAVQLLQKSSLTERTEQYWKWHRFSHESQSVLVYGMIPRKAVLASVPLLSILRKMPSYFLRKDVQTIYGNPLDQVAWNFALRKHNYRQFCEDMSKVFQGRSPEVKLRDLTAGSVRLALAFLRPFFHRVVQEDFDIAISYLRILATTISEWPGDKWARDHGEIRKIIETMVLALGEELREKYFAQKQEEISRLQLVIQDLQQTIDTHNAETTRPVVEVADTHSDDDEFDIGFEDLEEPTLVTMDLPPVSKDPAPLQTAFAVLPGIPIVFRTPITPPESPRNSLFVAATAPAVPLEDLISPPYIPNHVAEASQHDDDVEIPLGLQKSPLSEEPASPPPTPPSRSPVFLPTLSPVIEDPVASNEGLTQPQQDESNSIKLSPQCVVEHKEPFALEIEQEEQKNDVTIDEGHLEVLRTEVLEQITLFKEEPLHDVHEEVGLHQEGLGSGIHVDEDEDDGDQTDLELPSEHEHHVPLSPSSPWVSVPRMRPKVSSFSSTRSSIASLDTLCDAGVEFPLKRLSLGKVDSFEIIPPYPSFRSFGIASRTISFSEHSPKYPLSPALNPTAIPLPPSPDISLGSLSPSNSTLSLPPSPSPLRSNYLGSLPLSPASSLHSTRSLSSSSLSGSMPGTPTPPPSAGLPIVPVGVIIPPKGRISLLSPLIEAQDVEDDDEDDSSSIRSIRVAETAQYIVTGFLVGAFITLFLFSTQRRQLIMLT